MSIPDDVFRDAERLARRSGKSRSQLYSDALKEYVARHLTEEVTEAMDRVCSKLSGPSDPFLSSAASRVLGRNEW